MTFPFRLFVFLLSPLTILTAYIVFYTKQFLARPERQWIVVTLLALNLIILAVNLVRWIVGRLREDRILGLLYPLTALLLGAHFIALFTLHTLEEVTVSNLDTYTYMAVNIDSLERYRERHGLYPAGESSLVVGHLLVEEDLDWYRWDGWQNDFTVRIDERGDSFTMRSFGYDNREGMRTWPFYYGYLNPDLDLSYDSRTGWSEAPQPIVEAWKEREAMRRAMKNAFGGAE